MCLGMVNARRAAEKKDCCDEDNDQCGKKDDTPSNNVDDCSRLLQCRGRFHMSQL